MLHHRLHEGPGKTVPLGAARLPQVLVFRLQGPQDIQLAELSDDVARRVQYQNGPVAVAGAVKFLLRLFKGQHSFVQCRVFVHSGILRQRNHQVFHLVFFHFQPPFAAQTLGGLKK